MLKRKIYNELERFFRTERKALLVTGARQVGKTYAIRRVGHECFDHVVEINFLNDARMREAFAVPRNAKEILLRLSVLTEQELVVGKTLLFFDEVQECPELVTAIKFLVDEGSYRYVLSGSLLGVEMKDVRSVPVGYLSEREMFPLDFEEFCWAVGMSQSVMSHVKSCYEERCVVDPVVHEKLLELVRLYLLVGGMPEAVQRYIDSNNLRMVRTA